MPILLGARLLLSLTPKTLIWRLALPRRAPGAMPGRRITKATGNRWKIIALKFETSFDKEWLIWLLSRRDSTIVAGHEGPRPKTKGAGGLSTGASTLSFLRHLSVGSPPRPIFLTPAFTHPLQSSFPLEAPLNGANGTQAGSLCYINAVASSLQVHGDSSRDGPGRSLDSPEGQWSIA
jgi:hypothetical protein